MTRFAKKDYPVIFIGLGGTGKEMVRAIKRKFEECLVCEADGKPRRTAYMVLDADREDTAEFGRDYIDLTIPPPGVQALLANPINMTPEEREWFNTNLPDVAIEYGAGCIRQVGRLQLFRNFIDIKTKFIACVNEISRAIGGNNINKFDIVICAGLAGGTGSGTLIDMGYLASEWVREMLIGFSVKTYGFFAMPDLYSFGGDGLAMRKEANAYAALKELDYFMNCASPEARKGHIQRYPYGTEINWCNDWTGGYRHPYDLAFLLSSRFENGVPIPPDAKAEINNKVAEMMLSCYADEENTFGGFSFDAFMSNVSVGLLILNQQSTRPVNYTFASLGFGSSNVVEEYIQQYETEAVLEEVLTVPLFDHDGNAAVAGYKAVYAKDAQGIPQLIYTHRDDGIKPFMALEENRKEFLRAVFAPEEVGFEMEKLLEREEESFAKDNVYRTGDTSFETLRTITEESIKRHVERAVGTAGTLGWRSNAERNTYLLKTVLWKNFVTAAKAAIKNASAGPAALAEYLERIFVPELDNLVERWREESINQENTFAQKAEGIVNGINGALHPDGLAGVLVGIFGTPILTRKQKIDLEDAVKKEWRSAGRAKLKSVFAEERYKGMREFVNRVRIYLNNLVALNKALLTIQEEAGAKLDAAAASPNVLVSAGQIKNYFDSVAGRNRAVAMARDSILAELAEVSFSLEAPPKNATYEQLQQYNEKLLGAIGQFISRVHEDMNMGSLDWIVDVNPSVALASTKEKEAYVQHHIAPALESMAMPTLAVRASVDTANLNYISVPYDSPVLLQGIGNYCATNARHCTIKRSTQTNRLVQIKVRVGIALDDILGAEAMRNAFRRCCMEHKSQNGMKLLGANKDYIYNVGE